MGAGRAAPDSPALLPQSQYWTPNTLKKTNFYNNRINTEPFKNENFQSEIKVNLVELDLAGPICLTCLPGFVGGEDGFPGQGEGVGVPPLHGGAVPPLPPDLLTVGRAVSIAPRALSGNMEYCYLTTSTNTATFCLTDY